MPVTMKDVAKKAGVSIKTVSRVINDQGEISEDTRLKIMTIIDELGYRPNKLARGLLTGKTYTVGVIIPDITDPFFPDLILGAEQAARDRQFNVFLCNANREPNLELHYANILKDRQVDGLLLAGSRLQPEGLKNVVNNHKVVILSQYAIAGATVFSMNDYDASYAVGSYLYDLGHRKIAYLNGGWSGSSEHRLDGFIQSLIDRGLAREEVPVAQVLPTSHEVGFQRTVELLELHPEITAIACYNDILAIAALQGATAVGRHVPDDIAIVGYDDIPEATRITPALTTVHYDRKQIGSDMMNKLLDMVEDKSGEDMQISIEGYLLERQSCIAKDSFLGGE
ncbi:MAG: LacI family DNA-binding transcriptional regulator [Aggregatilineales bacterium]